jgi:acyl-CoA thioester hydrolase
MSRVATHEVQMRWGDIDALGHVKHPAAFVYFEEGRDEYLSGCGISRSEYVVGRCEVTWEAEIRPGAGTVIVETTVSELGNSSVTTSERILDERGNLMVAGSFGLVLWNAETRTPRPISDAEREALSA